MKMSLLSLLVLLFPLSAHAESPLAFADASTTFLSESKRVGVELDSLEQTHQIKNGSMNLKVRAAKKELEACTTFDCAQEKQKLVRDLEAKQNSASKMFRRNYSRRVNYLLKNGVQLALRAYLYELRNLLALDASYEHLVISGSRKCGPFGRSEARGMRRASAGVVEVSSCLEVNVDFKHGEYFYRARLALGSGYLQNSSLEKRSLSASKATLAEIETFFKGTTPDWANEIAQLPNPTFRRVRLNSSVGSGYGRNRWYQFSRFPKIGIFSGEPAAVKVE